LPRDLVEHLGAPGAHRRVRPLRRAGAGDQHRAGDVQLLGEGQPGARTAPGAQRPHGRDPARASAPLRRHRHRADAVAAAGGAGAGALHRPARAAGRADRFAHRRVEPGRAGAVPVLRGRSRPWCRDPRASLGHDGHRVDAQVLAAVAGRHARRTVARGLLPGVRRRARAAAQAQGLPGPRRRQLPLHHRPHRARLQHAPGPGRHRQPAQPARVPAAAVLRLLGRGPEGAGVPGRRLRRGPGDARHRLSVSAGRAGAGRGDRGHWPGRRRQGTPVPRHRAGVAGAAEGTLRMTEPFSDAYATARDAEDPLRGLRAEFHIPPHDGHEQAYFCGNSLGLQPRGAREYVEEVLDKWKVEAVEGHFTGSGQWMPYHELVRDGLAATVGAHPSEVVAMNSLTANLHLMLVSFYRPTAERPAILMEAGAFPSDRYALESQVRFHGFDPATDLIEVEPDEPDGTISMAAIERAIGEHGPRLALVLWPGVQYRPGQAFDMAEITRLGHAAGAVVGFDHAHAAGNLPLRLHDDGADFAVWCHYKYMNAGPGAVAGCFVHQRHARTG